jgi:hypothetical protein
MKKARRMMPGFLEFSGSLMPFRRQRLFFDFSFGWSRSLPWCGVMAVCVAASVAG